MDKSKILKPMNSILLILKEFFLGCFSQKINYVLGLLILVVVAMVGWIVVQWCIFFYTPLLPVSKQPVNVTLERGSTVLRFAYQLHKQHLLSDPDFFVLLVKMRGATRKLQAGEYQIDPGIKPAQFLSKMINGKVVQHYFTLVEGWNFRQVMATLYNNKFLRHTLTGLNDDAIMQRLGHDGENPEGRFAPATYYFSGSTDDIAILHTAYALMAEHLQQAWQQRSADATYDCPYKALIAASIIEKESAYSPERPKIAGVILRRLKVDMPLQMDPTVIYGLGSDYKGALTHAELSIDSSYNTYVRKGLPPTPIAMPSINAIIAALHPAAGTELYYVAKGDGSHVFTDTFAEHKAAVQTTQSK